MYFHCNIQCSYSYFIIFSSNYFKKYIINTKKLYNFITQELTCVSSVKIQYAKKTYNFDNTYIILCRFFYTLLRPLVEYFRTFYSINNR